MKLSAQVVILAAALSAASTSMASDLPTRFGVLSVNSENTLLLNGRPLQPEVQGNNSLTFVGLVPQGDADALILENNGGTACPLLVRIVTLTIAGAKASSEFGSCSDLVVYTIRDGEIHVSMPKMNSSGTELYRYANGVVMQRGRPVK